MHGTRDRLYSWWLGGWRGELKPFRVLAFCPPPGSPFAAWGRSLPWAGDGCGQAGFVFDPKAVTMEAAERHPLQFKTWLWFDTNQNLANNSQKRRGCDVCLGNTTEKDGWAGNSVYRMSVKSKLNSATFTYMYYVFWPRFPRVTRVCTANTWASNFTGVQDSRKYWATPWKSGLF